MDNNYQINIPVNTTRESVRGTQPPIGCIDAETPGYETVSSPIVLAIGDHKAVCWAPYWRILRAAPKNPRPGLSGLSPAMLKFFGLSYGDVSSMVYRGRGIDAYEHHHCNADVVCFNNLDALMKIIQYSINSIQDIADHESLYSHRVTYPYYGEQGGLNIFYSLAKQNRIDYKVTCVDAPNYLSKTVYNTRAKKLGTDNYIVKDEKLFTSDMKQIKVWHYCEGFGKHVDDLEEVVNNWINVRFNAETRKFFTQHCNTGDFFEKEFKL